MSRGWRNGLAVKSTRYSNRGPDQSPDLSIHMQLKMPETPASRDLMLALASVGCAYTHAHTHTLKNVIGRWGVLCIPLITVFKQ